MKKKTNIPDKAIFMDREKEAAFWEKNFDKAWKKSRKIKVIFAKNLSTTINVRLDPKTLGIVRSEAQRKGLGPTQLIRMWIMEKISKENYLK